MKFLYLQRHLLQLLDGHPETDYLHLSQLSPMTTRDGTWHSLDRLRKRGYVVSRRPDDGGRLIWRLTEKGQEWVDNYLERW